MGLSEWDEGGKDWGTYGLYRSEWSTGQGEYENEYWLEKQLADGVGWMLGIELKEHEEQMKQMSGKRKRYIKMEQKWKTCIVV